MRIELRDYRDLSESQPFDKVLSVGVFEHFGKANMGGYFQKILRLLAAGGLVLNHGTSAGDLQQRQMGAGMGNFIGESIFPGGELLHVSTVLGHPANAVLEMVDTENLRPHYARTPWDWSDVLETRFGEARAVLAGDSGPQAPRKNPARLPAVSGGQRNEFQAGLDALHQVLATRLAAAFQSELIRCTQSPCPFNRKFMFG